MNRLRFLLIGLFLFLVAGGILFFGIRFSYGFLDPQPLAQAPHEPILLTFISWITLPCLILGFVIWLWALVHMLGNQALQGTDKIVWVLVIIFLNILGAILYFTLCPSARVPASGQAKAQV